MMTSTKKTEEAKSVLVDSLQDTDICCGRGRGFYVHPGNLKFQETIRANLERYSTATSKKGKIDVVSSIVSDLRDQGVRFVKKDTASGKWYDIGRVQAHEKTGHAIRDHILNKSKHRQAEQAIEKKKLHASQNTAMRRNAICLKEGCVDLLVSEQNHGVDQMSTCCDPLSTKDVLEACSSLVAVDEQPEGAERNQSLTTILPSDWL
jgi:hypothetical protein